MEQLLTSAGLDGSTKHLYDVASVTLFSKHSFSWRQCFFSIFYINGTINKHLLSPYAAHFGRCSKEGTLVRLVQMDSGFTVIHACVPC